MFNNLLTAGVNTESELDSLQFRSTDVIELLCMILCFELRCSIYTSHELIQVMGETGSIMFTVFAFVVLNFTSITALQADARTIWAYSRDEMLPGSRECMSSQ